MGNWEWGIGNGDILPYDAWMAYLDYFQIWIHFKCNAMKKTYRNEITFSSICNTLNMVLCFYFGIMFFRPIVFDRPILLLLCHRKKLQPRAIRQTVPIPFSRFPIPEDTNPKS